MIKIKWRWPQIHISVVPLQERHFVTLAIFALAVAMLLMARENPGLWDIELFKIILQAVIISGIIGSIIAFHFSANKGDETRTNAAATAVETVKAAVEKLPTPPAAEPAVDAATQVADAAQAEADRITGGN